MHPHGWLRVTIWFLVAVLVATVTPLEAHAKDRLPTAPSTGPEGTRLTTEDEEARLHRAEWDRLKVRMERANSLGTPTGSGQIGVQAFEGARQITGPYFRRGSYLIEDDSTSGVLSAISEVALRVLGVTWKTVGRIISNIRFYWGLIPDEGQPAEAKSFRSYSYYLRDGEYFKNGAWFTGVRVERRDTYALGWSAFYDSDGVPHARFERQGRGEFVRDDSACHFWDDAWIDGMTRHTYTGAPAFVGESWNQCNFFRP